MAIRIIDNKKVDITNDEFAMYQDICKANDRPNFEGKSLFEDLFEVNDGIIIFVKPPRKKFSSMEVYCFLISIMVNQHVRIMHEQTNMLIKEAREEYNKITEEHKKAFDELKKQVTKFVEEQEDKPVKATNSRSKAKKKKTK